MDIWGLFCEQTVEIMRLYRDKAELLALLKRLRGWDMLDATADGPYWKMELDAAIAKAEAK